MAISCLRMGCSLGALTTSGGILNSYHMLRPKVFTCEPFRVAILITRPASKKIKFERVKLAELSRFTKDCFIAVGVPPKNARAMSEMLLAAECNGHPSHGLNRLEFYLNSIKSGITDGCACPAIINQTKSTAWVDARNALGPVVGNFCMDLAMDKAKKTGVGWVSAKNCTHYGIGSYYPQRAIDAGFIGICLTNTTPMMAPTNAKVGALGTNPLSVGAPAVECDDFLLDIATSTVAYGKIELAARKGTKIPPIWGYDESGAPTTDPKAVHSLTPLGGSPAGSAHKGYGLAAAIDILSGVLSGANFLTKVGNVRDRKPPKLGQTFIAVNPQCFDTHFKENVKVFNEMLRCLPPIDQDRPVLVPGDVERKHMRKAVESDHIKVVSQQIKACEALAKQLNIKPMDTL